MDFSSKFNDVNEVKDVYDFRSLNNLKHSVLSRGAVKQKADDEVAKNFESIFIAMLLKDFRKNNDLFKSELSLSSDSLKLFTGMYDQQLASDLSKHSIFGISNLLKRQLNESGNAEVNYGDNAESDVSELLKSQLGSNKTSSSEEIKSQEEYKLDFINSLSSYIDDLSKHLHLDAKDLMNYAGRINSWGSSLPLNKKGGSSFNFFHIAADPKWQGDSVNITTLGMSNGLLLKENKKLKAYSGISQAFSDFRNNLDVSLFS